MDALPLRSGTRVSQTNAALPDPKVSPMNPRRWWTIAFFVAALMCGSAGTAEACPSCKTANETDSRRPTAYMYSILFMMSMPAVVLTGFGIGFYRINRRHRAALEGRYSDPGIDLPDSDQ